MGLDQEKIKKRLSQIEMDINKMNQMIDDNLHLEDEKAEKAGTSPTDDPNAATGGDTNFAKSADVETSEVKPLDIDIEPMKRETTGKAVEEAIDEPTQTNTEETKTDIPSEVAVPTTTESHPHKHRLESIYASESDDASREGNKDIEPLVEKNDAGEWEEVDNDAEDEGEVSITQDNIVPKDNESVPDNSIINDVQLETSDAETSKIILPRRSTKEEAVTQDNDDNDAKINKEMIDNLNSRRISSRPFRVISVGSTGNDKSSRKSSMESVRSRSYTDAVPESDEDIINRLEQRYDYLSQKTTKLTKEIEYLNGMMDQGNMNIEDAKKLKVALKKLQEYLDRKNKEKYEIGVLLSRQLRKQIDRGENGQFWVGNK